ncbi:LysR family transcriptional regulator [Streptomyces sp. NPDC057702]|uniref:LysR family transcriptional regulator n=1 Tax=unclassified Streptomyces TaxID=2593676 RepID=UPI003695DAE2
MTELRTLRYFVTVADELHFGRAAARLQMTRPPLSRAIKRLETDLGCVLVDRPPRGVALTPAGALLHEEARALLASAERARERVSAAAGAATVTVGSLGNSVEQVGAELAAAFRRRHPGVRVDIREADFADPTAGLRAGLVDVALTRAPFEDTGITTRELSADPVGIVPRADDPLAGRATLRLADVADRGWFRFPAGTDPVWRRLWTGPGEADRDRRGPVVRTVHECLQAVLWSGSIGMAPLGHALPTGLTVVPLADAPPSPQVIAWRTARPGPLARFFVRVALEHHRGARTPSVGAAGHGPGGRARGSGA